MFKSNISQPLNTGQTSVSSLLRRPGNWSGRHIVGAQPGRSGFSSIELENRNEATSQHTQNVINNIKICLFFFNKGKRKKNREKYFRFSMTSLVYSVWNIQSFNTHLESLLFQLVGCGKEIGTERMLGWWEGSRMFALNFSFSNQ